MTKRSTSSASRAVKLFKRGRRQIDRIPHAFELPAKTALLTGHGGRLILEPVAKRNFIAALRTLGPLPPADRFPMVEDQPPEPIGL
jgi:antitoxin VapB